MSGTKSPVARLGKAKLVQCTVFLVLLDVKDNFLDSASTKLLIL